MAEQQQQQEQPQQNVAGYPPPGYPIALQDPPAPLKAPSKWTFHLKNRSQTRDGDKGCIEGCLAALCCCCVLEECC